MNIGAPELLIVLAVVLLLFGSKKLPDLARGMGQAAKEFRGGLHDAESEGAAAGAVDASGVAEKSGENPASAETPEAPAS